MSVQKARLRGKFKVKHFRNGEQIGEYEFPNGIVNAGLNHLLDSTFGGGSQITVWHIGLVDNAGFSAFNNADTMGSHTGWDENEDYDETERQVWDVGSADARAISNGSTADFSMNDTATIHGIFVAGGTDSEVKGASTGVLWATAAFGSNVAVQNGDTLKITYTVSG